MGRPLNKRYFGEPTAGGDQLKVQFHNGTASVKGWIVKQLGTKKFRCTDGTVVADCHITDAASAALTEGQMSITVKDDLGVAKQITKIAAHKVTVNTGESVAYNYSDSTTDGAVEIEEAGDDASMTNATDLEGDD